MEIDIDGLIRYVDCIGGVVFQGEFQWYCTDNVEWFLDESQPYLDLQNLPEPTLVDQLHAAEEYLAEMEEYKCSSAELQRELTKWLPATDWHSLQFLCPSLRIDFDRQILESVFPEPESFESYVPNGWEGRFILDFAVDHQYNAFLGKFPIRFRYWVIDGKDVFKELLHLQE